MRLCPKCGKKSEEARCPDDGTATLVFAANPDSRLTEGTEVNGRYRIREMIGQGGFGAVYRATSIATDQDMAIKLLAVSLDSDDSDVIQRFFAEAQVTASLKHPNTIRVYDFGQTEGGALYIAMELLSGLPLNELLKRRVGQGEVLTEEEAINIGVQALRSLAEAHLANLVHRDLKPHNIFLHEVSGDEPVVKVLDFGIAKRLGSNLTGTGKAFGTPTYMSPEQAQNKPINGRSDLYSLAVVLYQCVAGKPPFEAENPLSVLLAHCSETAADLREVARTPVSDAFVSVIERAMSKDPDDRFATAIEMRQALEAARGSEKTETLRAPRGPMAAGVPGGQAHTVGYEPSGDERTAAYVAPVAHATRPTGVPRGATPRTGTTPKGMTPRTGSTPRPAVPMMAAPDQPTLGFFSQSRTTDEDADADSPLPAPGGNKTRIVFAVLAAVLVLGGIGLGLALSGKQEPAPATAVAGSATPAPAAEATQAAPAVAPPAAAAAETPAPAAPGTAPDVVAAPPAEVDIELASEPAGAKVEIGGKHVGNAPVHVKVMGENHVDATLTAAGHMGMVVSLGHEDAPRKTIKLKPLADATPAAIKKPGAPRPTTPRPEGERPPRPKSALEERL